MPFALLDHPERKSQLDLMGFEWRLRDHTHKQQVDEDIFDRVYEGLRLYRDAVDEDLSSLGPDFTVPDAEPWPEHLWGLKLGMHLQAFRENEKYFSNEEKAKKLAELGLEGAKKVANLDRNAYTNKRFELVYKALEVYKSIHGNLMVPQSFNVPSCEPWPEDIWDLKLYVQIVIMLPCD